jgi:DNA-binding transcriptional MerR regulator
MARTVQTFSTSEAAQFAGVPYSSVDYWARTKLVVPSVADAKGIGSERLYDFGDIVALKVVKALRKDKISTQALRKALRRIRGVKDPLTESRLLAIGPTVVWVESDDEVTDIFKHPEQRVFPFIVKIVDYPQLVIEVVDAIAAQAA